MIATSPWKKACLCLGLWLLSASCLASPVFNAHSVADLHVDYRQVQAGQRFLAMLTIQAQAGWHVYWKNPGDSGMPPRITQTGPSAFQLLPLEYLPPQAHQLGPLVNYGYQGTAHYFLPIDTDAQAQRQSTTLLLHAEWLICDKECVPESGTFSVPLRIDDTSIPSPWYKTVHTHYEKRPAQLQGVYYHINKDTLRLVLPEHRLGNVKGLYFFPEQASVIQLASPQKYQGNELILERDFKAPPPTLSGILTIEHTQGENSNWQINAKLQNKAPIPMLLQMILFAFLGGLILNVMPCVFPILAIKALQIAKREHAHRHVLHALSYSLGILVSFAIIALILISLRAAGQAVGWGYQLQSPLLIALLAYLFFIIGLHFSGAFNISTRMMGFGARWFSSNPLIMSFLTGVLAVIVASPCSAPFMATAIGYAFSQPLLATLAIMLGLGVGFAFPLLMIACIPGLAKRLPKPGPWMIQFKKVLALLLFLSCVWLLWVLKQSISVTQLLYICAGLLGLGFSFWLRKQWSSSHWRRHGLIALLFLLCCWPIVLVTNSQANARPNTFTQEKLDIALAKQQAVLVNVTASWCLTCQYNEFTTLDRQDFKQLIKKNAVVYLKADWSQRDPVIFNYLAQFKRNSVPLYVYYNHQGEAKVLPQLLSLTMLKKLIETSKP